MFYRRCLILYLLSAVVQDNAKRRYREARSEADQKAEEAEARGRDIMDDVKERSGAIAHDVEARYDLAKQSVRQAGASTGKTYNEARDTTERKAREIRNDVGQMGTNAKEGWFSWKGWGKSKVEEGQDKMKQGEENVEQNLDKTGRTASQKVAEGAEEVRERAEKYT
jgi:hypothetical protein